MQTENPPRLLALAPADRADLLLIALPNAALREACRRLGLTFPGYRLERVQPAVMADHLAEVYEESGEDAATIDGIMDEHCPLPFTIPEDLIPRARIPSRLVELMTRLAGAEPESTLVALLWRLFGHPVESVRTAAASALRNRLDLYDQMARESPEGEVGQTEAPKGQEENRPSAAMAGLRRQLKEAESKAGRLSADLEAVRRQLTTERAQGAQKDERLSRLKRDLERAQTDLRAAREAKAALEAERDRDTRALLRQRESEVEDLRREMARMESELQEAHRREADHVSQLRSLETQPRPPTPVRQETPAAAAEPAPSFQLPEFTEEFYESIEGWDDRTLRTTFEKVLLLANDFTHPSLDAKPMQGAPGLYRIKIGSDVRLFYRRKSPRGIEILGLIDRENLDRYIRQYKRRAHA